jgi:hypothetical protein
VTALEGTEHVCAHKWYGSTAAGYADAGCEAVTTYATTNCARTHTQTADVPTGDIRYSHYSRHGRYSRYTRYSRFSRYSCSHRRRGDARASNQLLGGQTAMAKGAPRQGGATHGADARPPGAPA